MRNSITIALSLCATITCQASDYFIEPLIKADQRYESNLFLRPKPLQDNWISTLSPGVNFGLRHENGTLNSNFTWNHLFYNNQPELDIDEQLLSVNYKHNSERFEWGIGGAYNNQSSVNQLGTIFDPDPSFTQVMSEQISLAPTVTYSLDERNLLTLNYSYSKVTYDKIESLAFIDYDFHQASGTYSHLYSEKDTLNLILSSSRFNTPVLNQITFNHVAQLGWQHKFSEQLVAYVSGGLNYSQVETKLNPINPNGGTPIYIDPDTNEPTPQQPVLESDGIGKVFLLSLQKGYERGSVSLSGSQNQTPTSQGLQTQTQIALDNTFNITERWKSGLSASYSTFELTGQSNTQNNRSFYVIRPYVNWKMSSEINFDFSYSYRQQEFEQANQSSQGHTVQLQFSYQPEVNNQVK